jgi:hypothetical protein
MSRNKEGTALTLGFGETKTGPGDLLLYLIDVIIYMTIGLISVMVKKRGINV